MMARAQSLEAWLKSYLDRGLRPVKGPDYLYRRSDGVAIVRKRKFVLMSIEDGKQVGKDFYVAHRDELDLLLAGLSYTWDAQYVKHIETLPNDTSCWRSGIGPWGHGLLYRRPELDAALADGRTVTVVEGEKDADTAAKKWGLVATTHHGGGGGWTTAQAKVFRGSRGLVWIVMDRDQVGRQIAWSTALRLARDGGVSPERVAFYQPPKGLSDVSEMAHAGLGLGDLRRVPAARLARYIKRVRALPRRSGAGYRSRPG